MVEIEQIIEDGWELINSNLKVILVFVIMFLLGLVTILYQVSSDLKEVGEETTKETTDSIMGTFTELGDDLSKDIDDPSLKGVIVMCCIIFGICFVLMIVIPLGQMFKDLAESLNPIKIAKSFG